MKTTPTDLLYLLLPLALWPATFIVFKSQFIYAMSISTLILGAFTLVCYRRYVCWSRGGLPSVFLWGLAGAAALYAIFFIGYLAAIHLGMAGYVYQVYSEIYAQNGFALTAVLLALIGVFEELYWRGGLQGYMDKKPGRFKGKGWLASALYYSAVHISTLNPVLVAAAMFVGFTASSIAYRKGIAASTVTHVVWIELIVLILPVFHIIA